MARPVEDRAGKLTAIMSVGIQLEHFQDGLRLRNLPDGSVVQIVNENGTVVTRSVDSASWVGRNLRETAYVARHLTEKRASDAVLWPDNIERITGSATAHRVPWLVSVGLPADVALASVASRLSWGTAASIVASIMNGRFHDATVLLMGCDGMDSDGMAKAFDDTRPASAKDENYSSGR